MKRIDCWRLLMGVVLMAASMSLDAQTQQNPGSKAARQERTDLDQKETITLPVKGNNLGFKPASAGIKSISSTSRIQSSSGYGVTISGAKLTLSPGTVLSLGGDLVNAGTMNTTTGSTVHFNGTGDQEMSGVATIAGLKKSGGGTLRVDQPMVLNGDLQLASGQIALGSNSLTLSPLGSVSGASDSSYVVTDGTGVFTRQGVGAVNTLFPVGTTTTYNPVVLSNAGTADDFSVNVKDNLDHPVVIPNSSVTKQWTIVEGTPGGSNVTVTLQWNNATDVVNPVTNPVIGRWQGDSWQETLAVLDESAAPIVKATAAGFSSFSDFAVGQAGALPIELVSFNATSRGDGSVLLNWKTVSETNNFGFNVQRRLDREIAYGELPDSFIPGHGTTTVPREYSYIDRNATQGKWWYRLKQTDLDGTVNYSHSISVEAAAAKIEDLVPQEFGLGQNFPNPFNPSTTIRYGLPQKATVHLTLFNTLGQQVSILAQGEQAAGYHEIRFEGNGLASGVYFYRLQAGEFVETRKLQLLR